MSAHRETDGLNEFDAVRAQIDAMMSRIQQAESERAREADPERLERALATATAARREALVEEPWADCLVVLPTVDGDGNPAGMLSVPDPITVAIWGDRLALDLLTVAGAEKTVEALLESLPGVIGDPAHLVPVLVAALREVASFTGGMIDALEDGPRPGTRRVLAEQAGVAWVRRRDLAGDEDAEGDMG